MFKIQEVVWDKAIFFKLVDKTYQQIGTKYFSPAKEKIRYKKRAYKIPANPSHLNKYGKRVYYIDMETGNQIRFTFQKFKNVMTTKELDDFLNRNMISEFVHSFGSQLKKDWMMYLLCVGCGIGVGWIIHSAVMGSV